MLTGLVAGEAASSMGSRPRLRMARWWRARLPVRRTWVSPVLCTFNARTNHRRSERPCFRHRDVPSGKSELDVCSLGSPARPGPCCAPTPLQFGARQAASQTSLSDCVRLSNDRADADTRCRHRLEFERKRALGVVTRAREADHLTLELT